MVGPKIVKIKIIDCNFRQFRNIAPIIISGDSVWMFQGILAIKFLIVYGPLKNVDEIPHKSDLSKKISTISKHIKNVKSVMFRRAPA